MPACFFRPYARLEPGDHHGAKGSFIDEDIDEEQTTGIRNVDAQNPADRARQNVWYTLSGSRLPDKPTEPGIYINNGRKIVIK